MIKLRSFRISVGILSTLEFLYYELFLYLRHVIKFSNQSFRLKLENMTEIQLFFSSAYHSNFFIYLIKLLQLVNIKDFDFVVNQLEV